MATVGFTSFYPEVAPLVPGCADILMTNAIRNAAIEFCEQSLFWQEVQDAVDVTSTDLPYDLEAPAGARVCQIISGAVDGKPISPIALTILETRVDWATLTAEIPTHFYQQNPNQYSLFPLPTGTVSVVLRTAYSPTREAVEIEEHLYQTQLETIAAGALARLMELPQQPWSNPELGKFFRAKFMQGINDASIKANRSFGSADLVVSFPGFE